MNAKPEKTPLTSAIAKWYGYIFAGFFLIYGGAKIILGVLDRNYDETSMSIIFLLIGIVLISVAFAYRDNKPWGWYGLVCINVLVIILSLFGLQHTESYVLIVLSLGGLGALFAPATKQCFFRGR